MDEGWFAVMLITLISIFSVGLVYHLYRGINKK